METTAASHSRSKNSRNRNIINARRAIAEFVESNIPRLNGWLNQVANGVQARTVEGKPVIDSYGSPVWLIKPDPLAALKVVGDLTEYHLPKLSRTEAALTVEHVDPTKMSKAQLEQAILASLGVDAVDGEFVQVPDTLPAFLQREQAG